MFRGAVHFKVHRVEMIDDWWSVSTSALHHIQEISKAHQRRSGVPIYLPFMYHKGFLPREIALDYVNVAGPGPKSRLALTISKVRYMVAEYKLTYVDGSIQIASNLRCMATCKTGIRTWNWSKTKSHHRHCSLWAARREPQTPQGINKGQEIKKKEVGASGHWRHIVALPVCT